MASLPLRDATESVTLTLLDVEDAVGLGSLREDDRVAREPHDPARDAGRVEERLHFEWGHRTAPDCGRDRLSS